jgi:hypothetical protein
MLFNKLHQNTWTSALIIVILVATMWVRLFVVDLAHITTLDNPAMPLWSGWIQPWFGFSQCRSALLSFVLVLLTGFAISRMVSQYNLMNYQGLMPLFIFSLMTSVFLSVQKLNPVLIYLFFVVHGLERLFGSPTQNRNTNRCFDAAFFMGIGSLFYAKGIFFFPILIISMGILRVANLRSFMAAIIGLMLPFIFSFTYFFLVNKEGWFLTELQENLIANPGQYNHTIFSRIFMTAIIFLLVVSILSAFQHLPAQKIVNRFYFRIFIWILLVSSIAVLTPFFSMEMIPLSAVGGSVLLTNLFEKMKRKWVKELCFSAFVALIVTGYFFLY